MKIPPKRFLLAAGLALSLSLTCVSPIFTGCAITGTREAVVHNTFRSTYNAARTAYESYLELVVKGKVSADKEAKADAAWNQFRTAFALAYKTASNNWSAATPAETQQLADAFIKLVRSL